MALLTIPALTTVLRKEILMAITRMQWVPVCEVAQRNWLTQVLSPSWALTSLPSFYVNAFAPDGSDLEAAYDVVDNDVLV